jgi:hypothetical protein
MSDLSQGIKVLKASPTGIPRQRMLYVDNQYLYWACPNSALTKYIRINEITKISPL